MATTITKANGRQVLSSVNAAIENLEEIRDRVNSNGMNPHDAARYLAWAQGYATRAASDIIALLQQ